MKLTPEEQEVLENTRFIHVKRMVSEKIVTALGDFQQDIEVQLDTLPYSNWLKSKIRQHPKVSRGENYGGLPYFILDFPREFSNSGETLAIRTMILWGRFYSFTLHVTGPLRDSLHQSLIHQKADFSTYYYCINATPWEYHYEADNYVLLSDISNDHLSDDLSGRDFSKLSIWYPIHELDHLKSRGLAFYRKIISLNM